RAVAPAEHVPIIFLAENKEEAKEAVDAHLSLVDCVTAPFEPAALKVRIEAAVRTGENIGALRSRGTNLLLSVLDPLTRLYHRRYLLHVLGYEAARSVRYKSPLSVMLVD
ncbi:MAG: hypothetical protein M1482_16005, partial [Chloroflexi bacterium]|nr:hypothetical protein [Chloroflexota bacterium]